MTFGVLLSHDSGATWEWMCEAAVGYAGTYDPDYAYTDTGALFATTFNGLVVARDSCTFNPTPTAMTFVSRISEGPDNALYAGASDPMDAKIYKSVDDGATFPPSANPGQANDWWESVVTVPGNANDLFLSGFRFVPACDQNSAMQYKSCSLTNNNADCIDGTHPNGTCEMQRVLLFYKSTNGGTSFTAMPGNLEFAGATTSLTTSGNSIVDLVGVSNDGSTLYARVTFEIASAVPAKDGLYKFNGTTWTHLLSVQDNMSFLLRANGDLVVGTPTSGSQKSTNGGTTWSPLTGPPHINCLTENASGEVWACTSQFGSQTVTPDGYGIMKTTDLATWTGVLSYADIKGPVSCPAGTPQHDMCSAQTWCGLVPQLGITSSPINCAALNPEVPADAPVTVKPPGKGCCDTGASGASSGVLFVLVTALLVTRRRSKLG
jgi:hypothetical protein